MQHVSTTWAYVAETSCNQLLLIDCLCYVYAHQDLFVSCHNVAISLYNIIGHFCVINVYISNISFIVPCIPINWVSFLSVVLFCSLSFLSLWPVSQHWLHTSVTYCCHINKYIRIYRLQLVNQHNMVSITTMCTHGQQPLQSATSLLLVRRHFKCGWTAAFHGHCVCQPRTMSLGGFHAFQYYH